MLDSKVRRIRTLRIRILIAALVLLGLIGVPADTLAGTGRLVSHWMTEAPAIDGTISPGEWNEATLVELASGVTLHLGNDGRTLYFAVLDSGDLNHDATDLFAIEFDDEGGASPILDDDGWTNTVCQLDPALGEGEIGFQFDQEVYYSEFLQDLTGCQYFITDRVRFRSALHVGEGVTYEAAIPLDGPSPLRAGPRTEFAVWIAVIRNGLYAAAFPTSVANPPEFRNLILAANACNTGPQTFSDTFFPYFGLPFDWTRAGASAGWLQSETGGTPADCTANVTGGGGGAACVANGSYVTEEALGELHMPISVAGQHLASLRFRATLLQGDPSDFFRISSRKRGQVLEAPLAWTSNHPGEQVTVNMDLQGPPYLGALPTDLVFDHNTYIAGGIVGGYAQIDDVELICGPILFADDFESGLTTHWSADVP